MLCLGFACLPTLYTSERKTSSASVVNTMTLPYTAAGYVKPHKIIFLCIKTSYVFKYLTGISLGTFRLTRRKIQRRELKVNFPLLTTWNFAGARYLLWSLYATTNQWVLLYDVWCCFCRSTSSSIIPYQGDCHNGKSDFWWHFTKLTKFPSSVSSPFETFGAADNCWLDTCGFRFCLFPEFDGQVPLTASANAFRCCYGLFAGKRYSDSWPDEIRPVLGRLTMRSALGFLRAL
jgi:hypothetical protein